MLVLYTYFDSLIQDEIWGDLVAGIPRGMLTEIMRYVHWQDRQAHLLGKLLLVEGLGRFDYSPKVLEQIELGEYKKPFLRNGIHFNISHSGNYAVCALDEENPVGVDIERIRPIEVRKFSSFFSEQQWNIVLERGASLDSFYDLWTTLESVIKWEGKGIYCDLKSVRVFDSHAEVGDKSCRHQKVNIAPNYPCHVAGNGDWSNLQPEFISLGDLKHD